MESLDTNEVWSCGCAETALGFPRSCCIGQLGRDAVKWSFTNTNQKPDDSGTIEGINDTIDIEL